MIPTYTNNNSNSKIENIECINNISICGNPNTDRENAEKLVNIWKYSKNFNPALEEKIAEFLHYIPSALEKEANALKKKEMYALCNKILLKNISETTPFQDLEYWKFVKPYENLEESKLQCEKNISKSISAAAAKYNPAIEVKYTLRDLTKKGIKLGFLELVGINDDQIFIDIITNQPNITSLTLKNSKVTEAIGPSLAKLTKLKILNFHSCQEITDKIFNQVKELPLEISRI